MTSANDQVMTIVRANLDPATAKIIEDAMGEAARISIIRDAFLEGRDVEAVKMLRDLDPTGIRKVLGCRTNVPVPAGCAVQVTTRPQMPFTANRFVVSVSCASSFLISEIRVGMRSMFVQAGEIDADLFSADAPISKTQARTMGWTGSSRSGSASKQSRVSVSRSTYRKCFQVTTSSWSPST